MQDVRIERSRLEEIKQTRAYFGKRWLVLWVQLDRWQFGCGNHGVWHKGGGGGGCSWERSIVVGVSLWH